MLLSALSALPCTAKTTARWVNGARVLGTSSGKSLSQKLSQSLRQSWGKQWRISAGIGLLTLCSTAAWAQAPNTAAQRLEQLRLSLLERAVQAAVRVDTTAWIDSQGRLQETSRFRQSLKFGEVQASLAAQAHMQAQAQAQDVQQRTAQDLTRQNGLMAELDKACAPGATGLQHVIQFETEMAPEVPAAWQSPLRAAIHESDWHRTRNAKWRLLPAAATEPYASPYEQALMQGPRIQTAWRLKVRVSMPRGPGTALRLEMSLLQSDGTQNQYKDESWLPVQTMASDWSEPAWTRASVEALNARLTMWSNRLAQWLQCQPVRPAVTAQSGKTFTIAAGQLAGIKTGDEWVLLQPQRLSTHMMEPETLAHLVHATVVEVLPHSAKLRLDAGPTLELANEPGQWQAWSWADLQALTSAPEAAKVAYQPTPETRWPAANAARKSPL
jgi:hypothetical protein